MGGWTHNDLERMGAAEELQRATYVRPMIATQAQATTLKLAPSE